MRTYRRANRSLIYPRLPAVVAVVCGDRSRRRWLRFPVEQARLSVPVGVASPSQLPGRGSSRDLAVGTGGPGCPLPASRATSSPTRSASTTVRPGGDKPGGNRVMLGSHHPAPCGPGFRSHDVLTMAAELRLPSRPASAARKIRTESCGLVACPAWGVMNYAGTLRVCGLGSLTRPGWPAGLRDALTGRGCGQHMSGNVVHQSGGPGNAHAGDVSSGLSCMVSPTVQAYGGRYWSRSTHWTARHSRATMDLMWSR